MWNKIKSWKFWHNCLQVLIAFDQMLFCVIATILSIFNSSITAYADMTISAQSYRKKDKWYGKVMMFAIDALFLIVSLGSIKQHCKLSYESELKRNHLPDECV